MPRRVPRKKQRAAEHRPYRVEIADRATAGLDHVADWYTERHPTGLERFLTDFSVARDLLSVFATAGRMRPEFRADLRSYVVHPFVAFYTVDDTNRRVIIERILHGHLDIDEGDF